MVIVSGIKADEEIVYALVDYRNSELGDHCSLPRDGTNFVRHICFLRSHSRTFVVGSRNHASIDLLELIQDRLFMISIQNQAFPSYFINSLSH